MKSRLIISLLLLPVLSQAQVFVADQATVFVAPSALVHVNNGDIENEGTVVLEGEVDLIGSFLNSGTLESPMFGQPMFNLTGNWTNDGNTIAGTSNVLLKGTTQNIGGANSTIFYDLSLSGVNAIKTLDINTQVDGALDLNNSILATQIYTLILTDKDKAIKENGGFLQTAFQGSAELRSTGNLNFNYIMPFGYNPSSPVKRYFSLNRPAMGSYKVSFIEGDPMTYGMPGTALQDSICRILGNHFWQIESDQAVDFAMEKTTDDDPYTRVSRWLGPLWAQEQEMELADPPTFDHMAARQSAAGLTSYTFSSERPFVELAPDFEAFKNIKRDIDFTGYIPAGSSITWTPFDQLTCGVCLPTSFLSKYTDVLKVEVSNDICVAEDEITITVLDQPDLLVENAFSPTNDRLNEVFKPTMASYETLIAIRIYSRWGEKLYEGLEGWDGTYQSKPVHSGMYLYEVEFMREYSPTDSRRKFARGTVMLVR